MTRRLRRALAMLAVPAGLLFDPGAIRAGDPAPRPAAAAAARSDPQARIVAWLECEECTDEELAAVVALGPDAVPMLVATLRDGLSPASRARLELQLRERYAARREYGARRPEAAPALDADTFVAHHLATRDALYRSRAATALGRIRTPEAIEALRAALGAEPGPKPSVEQAIRSALE